MEVSHAALNLNALFLFHNFNTPYHNSKQTSNVCDLDFPNMLYIYTNMETKRLNLIFFIKIS